MLAKIGLQPLGVNPPTYSIIAFFAVSRFVDATLLEFDVNTYTELADIFAAD